MGGRAKAATPHSLMGLVSLATNTEALAQRKRGYHALASHAANAKDHIFDAFKKVNVGKSFSSRGTNLATFGHELEQTFGGFINRSLNAPSSPQNCNTAYFACV